MDEAMEAMVGAVLEFDRVREWLPYHTPKNLAMALCAEAGELAAELQWLTEAESESCSVERRARIRLEAADVAMYLVRLANRMGFDLEEAVLEKLAMNEARFPVGRRHPDQIDKSSRIGRPPESE